MQLNLKYFRNCTVWEAVFLSEDTDFILQPPKPLRYHCYSTSRMESTNDFDHLSQNSPSSSLQFYPNRTSPKLPTFLEHLTSVHSDNFLHLTFDVTNLCEPIDDLLVNKQIPDLGWVPYMAYLVTIAE